MVSDKELIIGGSSSRPSSGGGWDLLEKVVLVWIPALLVACRTGSRLPKILIDGSIGRLEGPQVDPSSPIFNLTEMFRYAVVYESALYPNMTESASWWESKSRTELPSSEDREGPKIIVHCPAAFVSLRSLYGISSQMYKKSILESGPFVSFQSNSKGSARTGGVFFITPDGSLLVKTIKKEEKDALIKMLPRYHAHMKSDAESSLLTRLLGLYEIQWTGGKSQYILVQNSIYPAEGSNGVLAQRYDLKGSTKGRFCSIEELEKPSAVLKDMDLVRDVRKICASKKNRLMKQLKRDVQLLSECHLIDYSLLVGIVELDQQPKLDSSSERVLIRYKNVLTDMELKKWDSPLAVIASPCIKGARFVGTPIVKGFQRILNEVRWSSTSYPFPYYGAESCAIHGGSLSLLEGKRQNMHILIYVGLIDFLQPFNTVKNLEYSYKKVRYGSGFSCVPPELYASRFLKFIDDQIK